MKKILNILGLSIAVFTLFSLINSCTKMEGMQENQMITLLQKSNKAKPNVIQCPEGYHWDFEYQGCVPDDPGCAPGFHWDPNEGGCVADNPPALPDTIAVIKNPSNPYDYVGRDHNEAVRTIFPNVNSSDPNVGLVIESQVKDYAINNWGYNADSIQAFYDTLEQRWNFPASLIPELDSLGNLLYVSGKISNETKNYIQEIYSIAYEWLNIVNPNTTAFNGFATDLIALEDQIGNDNSISEMEKKFLLAGCSTARYSGVYWGNYIKEDNLPTLPYTVHPYFLKGLFKKKWVKVVLMDIGGGLGGAIKGGFWGFIAGAASASITYAVK